MDSAFIFEILTKSWQFFSKLEINLMKIISWLFYGLLLVTINLASEPKTPVQVTDNVANENVINEDENGDENGSASTDTDAELVPEIETKLTEAAQRGESLHNAKCVICHGSEVYSRKDHRINSNGSLKNQVARCANSLGLEWMPDKEVVDVVAYLNEKYYQFELPEVSE